MSTEPDTDRFTPKVLAALDEVEYRRIDLVEEMDGIGRIRTEAYTVANLLSLNGHPLVDEVDFDENAYVFGVLHQGRLVSTVRLHHITPAHRVSTTFSIFPDALNAWLDDGRSIIDPVRFAADPSAVRSVPSLPYLTLRLAVMAASYLNADHVIQLSTPQHAAFYRRTFEGYQVADPIIGGNFNIPLGLQATDVARSLGSILKRYPFFDATAEEMKALFDRSGGRKASAPVKPSARSLLCNAV